MSKPNVIIYTDGACRGNPGPGGYGVILMAGNNLKEISQGYKLTTNNRMELLAVITGLEALKKEGLRVEIFTDSKYVADAVEKGWLNTWIATNFKGGKKNKDLWLHYHHLSSKQFIRIRWVKGHAENQYNNRCDELATAAADGPGLLIDEGYVKIKNEK